MLKIKKFKDIQLPTLTYQDMWYVSYDAPKPRVMGHRIFVPKENGTTHINAAFHAAYKLGTAMVDMKRWGGFKLVVEHGEAAGQEFDWPHFHLLPETPTK